MADGNSFFRRDTDAVSGAALGMAQDYWNFGTLFLRAMLEGASGRMTDTTRSASAGSAIAPVAPTEVMPLIARAMLATTASGLRTWQGLAQVHGAYPFILWHALLPSGSDGQAALKATRVQADELRAWFREIGDVSLREARRLQAELAELGETVAQGIEPLDSHAPHRRRWRPKS